MGTIQPGEHAILNDRCPWPERRGLLALVLRTDDCGHVYPARGLRKVDVVVFVNEDPLQPKKGPAILPNGLPWSCVVTQDCLTSLSEASPAELAQGPSYREGDSDGR